MPTPDFARARGHILARLSRELPPDLYYHGLPHTQEDVVPRIEQLAALEGITGEELLLLRTAAWYHDSGFLELYFNHEAASARLAAEVLPSFGYSPEQMRQVSELILATRIPQQPQNLLQQIICDADLDSLGRPDFFVWSHCLRLELEARGQPATLREWYRRQLAFQESHHFFTAAARSQRQAQKQVIITQLRDILGAKNPER